MERTCSTCRELKPLDQFHGDKNRKLGRSYRCKKCHSERMPKYANRRAAYLKAHPDKDKEIQARYRAKNPVKKAARKKVQTAIGNGSLIRPVECAKCGGGGPIEAHHADYSKHLDIVWLCRGCHHKEQ